MPQFYQPRPVAQTPKAPIGSITPEITDYWLKVVPNLFKTGLIRVSNDGGRTYPRSTEQALTDTIPGQPAAVRIYRPNADTWCLALDFDSSKGGPEAVEADHAQAVTFLASHGLTRTISDISPNGGRHLYVPLKKPIVLKAAKIITHALAGLYPTLDTSPMNGATDGLIRVPGSAHPSGGVQTPLTPLGKALFAVHVRNDVEEIRSLFTWAKSRKEAAIHHNPNLTAATSTPEGEPLAGKELILAAYQLPATRPAPLPLFTEWAHVAATGTWDKDRYPTGSEARLGLVRACVRAGHTFTSFLQLMDSPQGAGGKKLWGKYAPRHRKTQMARDFVKAHQFQGSQGNTQVCNTRETYTPPIKGALEKSAVASKKTDAEKSAYEMVRVWFAALLKVENDRYADDVPSRLVLRALGAMVQRTGEPLVAVGVRSLSLASGLSASTVSRALARLRSEADPFIRLVAPASGLEAAVYELVTPEHLVAEGFEPWFDGMIPAVDKAFFGLPLASALVYEVLTGSPVSSMDVAALSGVPVRSVQAVLELLHTLGLAERTGDGWVVGQAPLADVAVVSGGAARFALMVAAVRVQRAAWYRFVVSRMVGSGFTPGPGDVGVDSASGEVYDPAAGAWFVPGTGELVPA